MSQVRLYLDEDAMSKALLLGLRSRGIDVTSASETEMVNQDDADQLLTATSLGRALYSYNIADYCALHRQWSAQSRPHSGIIVARQRLPIGDEIRKILRLLGATSAEQMQNRLEYLSNW
jgi:hypothetical protein